MKRLDLTGQQFTYYKAIKYIKTVNGRTVWECICKCGSIRHVHTANLRSGHSKSCGCYQKENPSFVKHRMSSTSFYKVWRGILNRTLNPNTAAYQKWYKHIPLCKRWHDFENFKIDMFDSYQQTLKKNPGVRISIERINNKRGYAPKNCRWATPQEQANNTRRNRVFTHRGKTMNLKQWARFYNIRYLRLYKRVVLLGWDFEKAITTPAKQSSGLMPSITPSLSNG